MKKIFLASFFMMHIFNLYSQTKGLVLDRNNMPINKVAVYLADQDILLSTKEDGTFFIESSIPYNSYIHFVFLLYMFRLIYH